MLFLSDDDLQREQRRVRSATKDAAPPPLELWREALEDARELRAHQRTRQFAYLLFVAPVLFALAAAIVELILRFAFS